MERAAGTFQDRLVTELRLSDARTMDQATAVLQDFLPRYNARFAVQPDHPEPAYRPADPDLILSEILCFKDTRKVGRDNTVKYNWRVLQLLPDRERTSYAGLRVEVLERPNGQLIVRYEGRRVATQEPPPRMGALWAGVTAWSPGPELKRVVSSVGDHHISRSQQRRLAALEPVRPAAPALKPVAGKDAAAKDAASKTSNPWTRTPTPTQLARWKAIQKGRLKGLSLRAISRELGISLSRGEWAFASGGFRSVSRPPGGGCLSVYPVPAAAERSAGAPGSVADQRRLTSEQFIGNDNNGAHTTPLHCSGIHSNGMG